MHALVCVIRLLRVFKPARSESSMRATSWNHLHQRFSDQFWNRLRSVFSGAGGEGLTSPAISSWLAGNLTPIRTLRRMCCLGACIALLWRFRELPEDLASYGPLPGLLSAAASLLFSCSVVAFSALLRSLHCCLFVAIILPFAPSCGPCLYFIYSSYFFVK